MISGKKQLPHPRNINIIKVDGVDRIPLLNNSLPRETNDGRAKSPSFMGTKLMTDVRRQTGLIGNHGIGRDNIGLIGISLF